MRARILRRAAACGLTAAWLSAALSAALSGASVPRYSVEDLVNGSEWIVEGTVGASHADWDSAHKFIWTHYEVKVLDSLRGARQESITVSEPGGALDGIEQSTSGTLPYFAGEHVVLFLYRTPIGYLRTAGAGQGKFTVGADGRARANMLGISVTGAKRGTTLDAIDGLPLADFKLKLRALAPTGAR